MRQRPPVQLAPPAFATVAEYGARLSDTGFWRPYVVEALARHGLPPAPLEVGAVGSFPTFLAGRCVVKLFGEWIFGALCHEVERSLGRMLRAHAEIPAPPLIAEGQLFDAGWPWPYLIFTRLHGIPWSEARLDLSGQEQVARELGRVVRRLHALPPPTGPVWERDFLAELRATCVERQRRWGVLPAHLIDQIEGFLAAPSPGRRLIHADLHDHHVFVRGAHLAGIIDWGDALFADPYYELPPLHFGTFGGEPRLLRAFLDGYGWEVGPDFAHRAMTMTLLFEFNVIRKTRAAGDLGAVATLDELARLFWEI